MKRRKWYELRADVIRASFDDRTKVYRHHDLKSLVTEMRDLWSAPKYLNHDDIIQILENLEIVHGFEIKSADGLEEKILFAHGEPNAYQVALALRPSSYLSHATAAELHGLTRNILTTVYSTKEQSRKDATHQELQQESIDEAMRKPQRVAKTKYLYQDSTIVLLNGMSTGEAGVASIQSGGLTFRVTRVERTLIDLTVRPDYSGGVHQVLEAFERALGKVSVAALMTLLDKIGFIYPYHQAIGFYLEKAGYPEKFFGLLRKYGFDYDFYLAHGLEETTYDHHWHLYVPTGMEIMR